MEEDRGGNMYGDTCLVAHVQLCTSQINHTSLWHPPYTKVEKAMFVMPFFPEFMIIGYISWQNEHFLVLKICCQTVNKKSDGLWKTETERQYFAKNKNGTPTNGSCSCLQLCPSKHLATVTRKPSWYKGYVWQRHHSKMAVSRHLGFYRTASSAIRSANPENPNLERNMEWIGRTVWEIFAFKLYCDLETGVRGHSRSLKAALFDRAHTTLYSSSIITMPLSITISEI